MEQHVANAWSLANSNRHQYRCTRLYTRITWLRRLLDVVQRTIPLPAQLLLSYTCRCQTRCHNSRWKIFVRSWSLLTFDKQSRAWRAPINLAHLAASQTLQNRAASARSSQAPGRSQNPLRLTLSLGYSCHTTRSTLSRTRLPMASKWTLWQACTPVTQVELHAVTLRSRQRNQM